jgi:hypothetical protein
LHHWFDRSKDGNYVSLTDNDAVAHDLRAPRIAFTDGNSGRWVFISSTDFSRPILYFH